MLLFTLLLPVSTVFHNEFGLIFILYWLLAEPLAGAHGTLRFRGTQVENTAVLLHCYSSQRPIHCSAWCIKFSNVLVRRAGFTCCW